VIARLSVEQYALNDKLKIGLNVANSSSNASYLPLQNIVLLQTMVHLPVSPVKNPDGTYFENLTTTGYFNPVAMVDNAKDDGKYNSLIGGFTTELKLPAGFTLNTNGNYQKKDLLLTLINAATMEYILLRTYNNPDPGIGIAHQLIGNCLKNGSALRGSFQNTTKTIETFGTWDKKFGEHAINAVLGYSWHENTYGEGFQVSSTNFPTDNIGYSNLVLGNPYAIPSYRINLGNDLTYGQVKLISDYARVKYSFMDKYFLQATIRRDGSSVFGENNQWGYFPSGSIARISHENFMDEQSLFQDLKLRLSYGGR
jgi:iron complex outermembrane receptor protein